METVETLSLVSALWFSGMLLYFLFGTQANRYWRIALQGRSDGLPLQRRWRLIILYSQYWMSVMSMSIMWLVFAGICLVVEEHASSAAVQSCVRLVAYLMGVAAIGTMTFGTLGVRYVRRVILRDTAKFT